MVHLKINFVGNNPFVLHLEMPSETRIIDLKNRIETLYPQYEAPRQILSFRNHYISNYEYHTLEYFNIQGDDSKLQLSLRPPDNIRLKMTGIYNDDFIVQGNLKVGTFKEQVASRWRLPRDCEMSFFHQNHERDIHEEMDNNLDLYHYHLDKDSIIDARLSL